METLTSLNDGDAPFPTVGQRVSDSEWGPVDYGTVIDATYPRYTVQWDSDELTTTEKVRY